MKAALYPPADHTTQWFADTHPGTTFPTVQKVVLHSEETLGGWPGYSGGASAPNLSGLPDMQLQVIRWRQHFPVGMSARALVNAPGGVETNREDDGVVQIELAGCCDPKLAAQWERSGHRRNVDFIFWPEAPEWALRELAKLLAWLAREWGVPLQALPAHRWLPYPKSAGLSPARMSFTEWRGFRGVAAHSQIPENDHGDPGDLDIDALLGFARQYAAGATTRTVIVRVGMTLSAIAAAAGVTVGAVMAVNPGITDPNRIYEGQIVTLPPEARDPVLPGQPAPRPNPQAAPPPVKPAPAPAPAPGKGRVRATVSYGSRGPLVRIVQRAVGATPDGVFGPKTRAAVKAFQRRHHLVPDGIVGPKTWAVIAQ
ncbi:MAG TPA: peptidoglycan-binding domain-containing protein [Kineosporiaceae bacterium]|nr:peptidoglycan-binding domain-containing protein [Kineosporiaceae bacterium]